MPDEKMTPDEECVDVDVDIMYQTDLALICRGGNGQRVNVPKSLIRDPEVNDLENMATTAHLAGKYPSVTLTLPEWFAIQEELV